MKSALIFLVLLTMTGCGHNILSYSTGKSLNLGFEPNTQKLGVQYLNGEFLNVVEKDNSKLKVQTVDLLNAEGKITERKTKIVYEIKEQITGSDVEYKK